MKRTISLHELTVGMFVESYGRGDFPSPLVQVGKIIESQEEIDALRRLGIQHVTVDDSQSVSETAVPPTTAKIPLAEELPHAVHHYMQAARCSREFFELIRKGGNVPLYKAQTVVDPLIASILRNQSAAICLTRLSELDEYTYTHNVNVSVLAAIFGRSLGLDPAQLRQLALAGFFMDIGKALIPLEILTKPGRLSPQEMVVAQRHAADGQRLLQEYDPLLAQVALEHHERHSGHGYPQQLTGERIHEFARIASVCDVYDALTSDRVYAKSKTSAEAFRILFANRETEFEPQFVERFIKALGVYPVGSFVRLSNGKYAIVCDTNADKPLRPVVRVVFDNRMRPRLAEIVDLANTANTKYEHVDIRECINPRDYKVDVLRLLS